MHEVHMIEFVLGTRAAKLSADVESYCQHSIGIEPWLALRDQRYRLSVRDMNIETLAQ
jgi:hypothetical protein